MKRLIFTEAAESDIEAIGDFIAAENPRRAESFIAELRERCFGLLRMPERFAIVPPLRHLSIRRRVHGRYLIFYRITPQTVEILHILHGAMDYEKVLFPEE